MPSRTVHDVTMDPKLNRPPRYPDSPTQAEWDALSHDDRRSYLASIPVDPPPIEVMAPEGMPHSRPTRRGLAALGEFFRRRGRPVFLESDLPVIYPSEPSFAPDLIAVLDHALPPDEELPAWVVVDQGRGLDFALEVHVRGDWQKDGVRNVERYARLGIPEYFVFDRPRHRLLGYALPAPTARSYKPILPQCGRLSSNVLGLELGLVGGQLRFFLGTAEIPDASELIDRLDAIVRDMEDRLGKRDRALEEEQQRREQEQQRREEAERRAAELQAELDRLKSGK